MEVLEHKERERALESERKIAIDRIWELGLEVIVKYIKRNLEVLEHKEREWESKFGNLNLNRLKLNSENLKSKTEVVT